MQSAKWPKPVLANLLLSDAVGFWLVALSVTLSVLADFLFLQVRFWFRLLALTLMFLALVKYATSRMKVIRTHEDLRSQMEKILHVLDC